MVKMKKILIILFIFPSAIIYCQEYKNTIMTNGLGILGRLFSTSTYRNDLCYERKISKLFTISFDIEQGRYEYSTDEQLTGTILEELDRTGFGFSPEIRLYPFNKTRIAPKGFFMGAYYKYYFLSEKYYSLNSNTNQLDLIVNNSKGSASGFGFDLGYKFGKDWFICEPLIGYAFGNSSGLGQDTRIDPDFRDFEDWTIFLRIEVRIGICF